MEIELDNIEQFSIPLTEFIGKWIFTDENGDLASKEHQDQIWVLTKEAAQFLWNSESKFGIICSEKYFKNISVFDSRFSNNKEVKKYLYNLGIPFKQKVFISMQPDFGFVLTWKMVIKYSHNLFWANDQTVWDKTLNWKMEFHHDGEFTYGKDYIFDGQAEKLKQKEIIDKTLKEIEERKKNSSSQQKI